MSKSEKLYNKYGKDICVFPFVTGWYASAGNAINTLRPCPNISGVWPVIDRSITKTLASKQWADIRENFISGSCHTSSNCASCSYAEKHDSKSIRMLNNDFYSELMGDELLDIIESSINNNFCTDTIYGLDYFPSNYCNYSCIMCNGGASSSRGVFELKFLNKKYQPLINQVDNDFYQALNNVKVINLTGGETILQPQVHELIDYLINNNLAQNISLTMLTNVSSYPSRLIDKFKKFKRVDYTLSIDGTGEVLEYQRRGAVWDNVEDNAIKFNENFGPVVNHVITPVNVFNFVEFVSWCKQHNFDIVFLSLENSNAAFNLSAIPDNLKTELITNLTNSKFKYNNEHDKRYIELLDQMINILNSFKFDYNTLQQFIERIKIEDQASNRPLKDIVVEWRPYFD